MDHLHRYLRHLCDQCTAFRSTAQEAGAGIQLEAQRRDILQLGAGEAERPYSAALRPPTAYRTISMRISASWVHLHSLVPYQTTNNGGHQDIRAFSCRWVPPGNNL